MTRFSRSLFSLFFVLLISANAFADDGAPNWFRQAAAMNPPAFAKDVPAVVLHDEQQITLAADGRLLTTKNYAVKILSREGRQYAVALAFYYASFNKVREINGWLVRPDGSVKTFDKKVVIDQIADTDDIYNEGRLKIIDAAGEVDAGSIFGFTTVTEDKPLFFQDDWHVQSRLPVMLSRYSLNLPSGWKASSMTFNHAEVKPQISGTNYTWELRNLAPIATEPMSPSIRNLAPRVAVRYAPDAGSQGVNRVFVNWLEVSRWATALYEPQVIVDDAVAGKARELTANAKSELDKIRAIGTYVQNLQYISIDIGAGYGNGMIPRPSTLVLARGYGDCKDKANLMRAMLKSLKIEAYPIIIYSGDPTFVREEWASPNQFNHCIIAVKVSDETKAPTIMTDAKLGRLLIFDATDAYTPVGDLPDYLQGSNALVVAGENGGLLKMPVTPPETNLLDRNIEVSLASDGSIKGSIRETTNGQESTMSRAARRILSASDYNKMIEAWLTRGATGAQLVKMTPNDKLASASFDLDVEFSAPHYAQVMQNRLLVFKPVIVGRRNGVFLTEAKRDQPVLLDSNSMRETIVFNLPAGFVVDEMPDAVTLETPFARYATNYEVKDGKLVFTRSLVTKRATVAVENYKSVKDFYSKILSAEQSPVVLLKK